MSLDIYGGKKPFIAGEEGYIQDIVSEIDSEDIRALIGNEKLIRTDREFQLTKSEYDGWRVIYRVDGKILGAVQGVIMPDGAKVLSNIYVKPEFRKQGIGKKLVDYAQKEFKDLKLSNDFTKEGAKFFKVQESKMTFKDFYLTERAGSTFKNLIVVESIKFSISEFGNFLNSIRNNILYFYNGPDTIGSPDTPGVIIEWLVENNPELENLDWNNNNKNKITFADKGYAFFRDFLDHGISYNGVKQTLRYMYMHKITDSRDVPKEQWKNILSDIDYEHAHEAIEDEGITVFTPEIDIADLKANYNNCLLCGGGQNECLKEIQMLFSIFNIKYTLVDKFIY